MTQPTTSNPPVEPRKFQTETQWGTWDQNQNQGSVGLSSPGWALPSDPSQYIGKNDPYWTTTLAQAQNAYGDPGIRYNTDDIGQPRYLQFGDGTPLPKDGTILYHNTEASQNFVRNTDGSLTRQDFNGNPIGTGTFSPAGYRKVGDQYAPVDPSGNQVSPLIPISGVPSNFADRGNGILTPTSGNGDYYTVDPATGQINYFDKAGTPISEQDYLANAPHAEPGVAQAPAAGGRAAPAGPTPPVSQTPMQSQAVSIPTGMTRPVYPSWATEVDPDIPNQMTAVMVRLFSLFGSGTPAQSELPDFPFNTATGDKSGIDSYDAVKRQFVQIESQFDAAAKAYRDAVTNSAYRTEAGRQAINSAISSFNTSVASLPEKDWAGLLSAESTLLDQVKTQIVNTSTHQGDPVPANPDPAPGAPPVLPAPPADDAGAPPGGLDPAAAAAVPVPGAPGAPDQSRGEVKDTPATLDDLVQALGNTPAPAAPMAANPLGAMNPLGALGGMNPLGGLGGLGGMNPLGALGGLPGLGGPANPVTPLPEAAKPAPVKPLDAPAPESAPVSPITPAGPAAAAPPPEGLLPAELPPAAVSVPAEAGPAPAAAAAPVSLPDGEGKPAVTLPDGKVVEASDPRAAQAAQAALDKAAPGGDAAQKAYSQAGLELPSDGKNPGAKVDPADMQPGDVLKWGDKTMVAVAPGLVADPSQPGVTHTLQDVLKDPTGFQGMFRPTETDPTLSTHSTPPPLNDPTPPPAAPNSPPPAPPVPAPSVAPPSPAPGETVPLSGPAVPSGSSGQAAPPSPFEQEKPPPPVRSTKAERIAAGQE